MTVAISHNASIDTQSSSLRLSVTAVRWVVATFGGWTAGFILAILLVIGVESIGVPESQSPLALGMGFGVGFAQSRLLFVLARSRRHWIGTTAVGLAAPFIVADLTRLAHTPLPYNLAVFVALGGVTVSVAQWTILKRFSSSAAAWLLTSPLGWFLGGSMVWVSDRWLPRIPGVVGALLYLGVVLSGGFLLGVCTLAGRPRHARTA